MLSVILTGEVIFGKGHLVDQEGDGKFKFRFSLGRLVVRRSGKWTRSKSCPISGFCISL